MIPRIRRPTPSPIEFYKQASGLAQLSHEMVQLQHDVAKTVNEKLEEVDTAINEVQTAKDEIQSFSVEKIDEVNEKIDEKLQEVDSFTEEVATQIELALAELSKRKGPAGKDADEQAILEKVLSVLEKEVSRFPKVDDIIKSVIKKIPENKPSLKVIQESIDISGVVEKVKKELKSEDLKEWEEKWKNIKLEISRSKQGYHGGGFSNIANASGTVSTGLDTLKFTGSGVSSVTQNGRTVIVDINGAGATFYSDTVSGTINSVNQVFTVPNTINSAIALYLANSVYQPGVDFTVTGPTEITMTVAPDISLSGQSFWLSHT